MASSVCRDVRFPAVLSRGAVSTKPLPTGLTGGIVSVQGRRLVASGAAPARCPGGVLLPVDPSQPTPQAGEVGAGARSPSATAQPQPGMARGCAHLGEKGCKNNMREKKRKKRKKVGKMVYIYIYKEQGKNKKTSKVVRVAELNYGGWGRMINNPPAFLHHSHYSLQT